MASHRSALKAHRQSVKNRESNRHRRSQLRSALKGIRAAIDNNDIEGAKAAHSGMVSLIDRMVNKGVIHKNAAARYKSRLVGRLAGGSAAS